MANNPKMKPCPNCNDNDNLGVWDYDGNKHVECVKCDYLGPCSGSTRWAIKLYNAERDEQQASSVSPAA